MGVDDLTLGRERDVDEGLLLQHGVEDREDGGAMVVPLEAILLLRPHHDGGCRGPVKVGEGR